MLTLTPVPPERQHDEPPAIKGGAKTFDWDSKLSLELIRQHTKTDDVPGVVDEQLRLYRAAAIEAAEHFTGLLLSCQRIITEPIEGPARVRPGKLTYRHRLQYPVADEWIYLYGSRNPNDNGAFRVFPGARSVLVPIKSGMLDLSNCCDPCASHHLNAGMMATYKAGFASIDDVPAGVVLGMLQFMAWIVEHPGDELLTSRNRVDAKGGAVQGSNNIAVISGAMETWRQYDDSAI